MAISPPSDIVLDVARAAEPQTLEAARARLASRTAAAASGLAEAFSAGDLGSASPLGETDSAATPDTYRNFEAMVLSSFVESMLPKDAGAVYGDGMAGDMWKSLMSQQLGNVISDRGGIGIADRLLKDHYVDGETVVALGGVSGGPGQAAHDQEHRLSSALVDEMQRRLTADLAGRVAPASLDE